MGVASTPELSLRDAINQGFNRMAAAILGIAGLGFGSLIFEEADPIDKVDNSILVVVAILAVAWYFTARHRFERSPIPVLLAGLAVAGQILGIGIEYADATAIGDDIGGTLVYLPTLIVLYLVYSRMDRTGA
ncbi:MAG: hypothetical protein L3K06_03715 [Thermoplasmata archaeon]|nr:hypothetical protein [Thermoplasmata archaeon]